MPPKFGTSGLRGLVTELTPDLVADHVHAFLAACPQGGGVHIGQDLRPSSAAIAAVVREAVVTAGLEAVDCGAVPTPALALVAMARGHGAVMVTGSHIPADRNGLKFYLPTGEIAKADEARLLQALGRRLRAPGGRVSAADPGPAYLARYAAAFGPQALAGLRIGVYRHSTVARDLLQAAVAALGATAVPLAHSDRFIPVDTEAVDPKVRAALPQWCLDGGLDAVISADGDADRPLLADAEGRIVPGDVLGPLTARFLGAAVVCTPVSSNTLVEAIGAFAQVRRSKIGSPFVIAEMEAALQADPGARVVGYEANGGFLLGFTARGPAGPLAPLMTRDCLLPILAPLAAARAAGLSLRGLVDRLPARFTAADRATGIEPERALPAIAALADSADRRAAFFAGMPPVTGIDRTDGLRLTFASGEIVHFRPSGNAPELRCYAEAGTEARAQDLVNRHLARLSAELAPGQPPHLP